MVGLKKNKILKNWINIFNKIHKKKINLNAEKHWNILLNTNSLNINKEYDFIHEIKNKKFVYKKHKLSKDFKKNFESNILKINAVRLVFVNGYFNQEFSLKKKNSSFNIQITKSNRTKEKFNEIKNKEFFFHLIESLSTILLKIKVSNKYNNIPLYLLYINDSSAKDSINNIFYRTKLYISDMSECNIIEHYIDFDKNINFNGYSSVINIDNNARLNHIKLFQKNKKSYSIYYNESNLLQQSYLENINIFLGNKKILYKSYNKLNGNKINFNQQSLSLPNEKSIFDINSYLEHNYHECFSNQLHKNIINKNASLIFNGIIKVAKNTFRNNGKLTNNNLILHKSAKISTKPYLEIYSSDVKCSHGATIGYIDKNQIFYLQSRGIEKKLAKNIIIFAFASSLVVNIKNDIIKKFILKKIKLYLAQVNNNVFEY